MAHQSPITGRVVTMLPEKLTDIELPRHIRFRVADENEPNKHVMKHVLLSDIKPAGDMDFYQLINTFGDEFIVPGNTPIDVVIETAAEAANRIAAEKRAVAKDEAASNENISQLRIIQGGLA